MTCETCEKVRRFFRNGVAKVAPFTEITDAAGGVLVVANINNQVVGATEGLRYLIGGKVSYYVNSGAVELPGGAISFRPVLTKSVFVNHYK